jgi:hypothetical protein
MTSAKTLVSLQVHSFGLRWERVGDTEIVTAQALSHLFGFKDQAVPKTDLPRCIA